jgi:hypothetical protein
VHDLVTVQVAERHDQLSSDVLHGRLRKALYLVKVVVDVAAGHVAQEKIDSLLVLKHELHRVDKRMVGLKQNFFFVLDIFHLVFLEHHVLVEALHRIKLTVFSALNQKHFSEAALV